MLRIDRSNQNIFKGFTYQIHTPDGTMFVNVMEDMEGKLCAVDIKIGKAGLPLRAWAHCFGRLITMVLEHGGGLSEILEELSSQTADRSITSINGTKVRSGPEGVYNALNMYKEQKYQEAKHEFHVSGSGREIGRLNNRKKA
jgi:hypothetical protein